MTLTLKAVSRHKFSNFHVVKVTFAASADASNAKGIKLHWKEPGTSVGINEGLLIPNYRLVGHSEHTADVILTSGKKI